MFLGLSDFHESFGLLLIIQLQSLFACSVYLKGSDSCFTGQVCLHFRKTFGRDGGEDSQQQDTVGASCVHLSLCLSSCLSPSQQSAVSIRGCLSNARLSCAPLLSVCPPLHHCFAQSSLLEYPVL